SHTKNLPFREVLSLNQSQTIPLKMTAVIDFVIIKPRGKVFHHFHYIIYTRGPLQIKLIYYLRPKTYQYRP
ncbi:MAG: hypothetical protein KAH12_06965, partial [Anaerolineales bacterium]|nr:hypothetical protein [Anaerolineales bacterium]